MTNRFWKWPIRAVYSLVLILYTFSPQGMSAPARRTPSRISLAQASFDLGLRYLHQGRPAVANRYFEQSAQQGCASAWKALGDGYLSGDGIAKNHTKALICYVLGADLGYAPAQLTLGIILHNKEAGIVNLPLAKTYLQRATGSDDTAIAEIAQVFLKRLLNRDH